MSLRKRGLALGGIALAGALVLSACSSSGGGSGDSSGGTGTGGTVTINGTEPQNPLVPGNTNEVGGGNVLDSLFTGLVSYNAETAAPEMAVAESIESPDQKVWTIKLKDWTFQDGTPVTAQSFVDSWNWTANGNNAALNQYFFEPIEGYADVSGTFDEEGNLVEKPKKETMSGLKVIDDKTFEVTLSRPNSQFPTMVGYTAFFPLPQSFFDDPKAFGQAPVGNGPFKFASWDKKKAITVDTWDEYPGAEKPRVDQVTWKLYQSYDAAYADLLAGNLDVLDSIPQSGLVGEAYKADLGDRTVQQAAGVFQSVTFPMYDKRFENLDLRKAISMAIDRDTIIKNVFEGTRQKADGWVPPIVDGYKAGVCGENCNFDPTKAKEYLEKAGGFDDQLTISYNADGDHKGWVDATCVSIKDTLGIDCVGKSYADFGTFRTAIGEKEMTGLIRTGWQMDYPSIENFLVPLYKTGASANDGDYSNEQFDQLMDEGAAKAGAEGIAKFQEGEAILAQDMPVIPLWYGAVVAGYSESVTNVQFTPFSRVNVLTIEKIS